MHRSRSVLDVLSFSTVSVLSFYPTCVRALSVEEPQLGCVSSAAIKFLLYEYMGYYSLCRNRFVIGEHNCENLTREGRLLLQYFTFIFNFVAAYEKWRREP